MPRFELCNKHISCVTIGVRRTLLGFISPFVEKVSFTFGSCGYDQTQGHQFGFSCWGTNRITKLSSSSLLCANVSKQYSIASAVSIFMMQNVLQNTTTNMSLLIHIHWYSRWDAIWCIALHGQYCFVFPYFCIHSSSHWCNALHRQEIRVKRLAQLSPEINS